MNKKLKLLAKSALAIPGMVATTVSANGPTESEASYRYTLYSEDDSPASRDDSGGSQERYDIQVHQFSLLMPVAEKYSVSVDGSFETMAGASPVYSYVPDGEDKVYTHFAGASEESRFDLNVAGRQYNSTSDFGANTYISKEKDYLALSSGVDGNIQINDQMTTLSGGLSFGYDFMEPTSDYESGSDAQLVNEPAKYAAHDQTKWQVSIFEGVGQVIDKNTVVQGSLSYTYKNGYLSDMYRDCVGTQQDSIADGVPCDIRPSERSAGTLSLGVRRYLPSLNAALHADYRLYLDTWDIASHTLDIDYYQNWQPNLNFFSKHDIKFQFAPGVRYYQQSAAYFYEVPDVNDYAGYVYTADTTSYYSSDPRLSKYGAIALKGRVKIDIKDVSLVGYVERYTASPDLGFNDESIPGLVSYWRLTTGLDYRF